MLSVLEKLFGSPHPGLAVHVRVGLTPGQLYRLMSGEFRSFRSERCSCVMPMLFTSERAHPYACNWAVGPLGTACDTCEPLVAEIVARHRVVYDVKDAATMTLADGGCDGELGQSTSAGFPLFA